MSYYVARVKVAVDTAKGVKHVSESYLVNAATVTHAEALVNKDFQDTGVEFEVKSVSDTRICKVIESQNSN
jgi:hypothetical protein